jgi:hypothetical protein
MMPDEHVAAAIEPACLCRGAVPFSRIVPAPSPLGPMIVLRSEQRQNRNRRSQAASRSALARSWQEYISATLPTGMIKGSPGVRMANVR